MADGLELLGEFSDKIEVIYTCAVCLFYELNLAPDCFNVLIMTLSSRLDDRSSFRIRSRFGCLICISWNIYVVGFGSKGSVFVIDS